jgi:U3 small nucleolar ribonucleoprotein protein IMP4
MFITTSRKPSRKTRTFAKVLADFLNLEYVPRGKTGISEFLSERMIVIGEKDGNPFSMKIISPEGDSVNLYFNVSNILKVKTGKAPVIFKGEPPFDPSLFGAVGEGVKVNFKTEKKVLVKKINGWTILDFRYGEKSLFKLKLLNTGGL